MACEPIARQCHIQQHQRVAITYRSESNQITHRTIEPYRLLGWWRAWYLIAYCCLRQNYRQFRLDRIEDAQVLRETFVPDEHFDAQAYIQAQLGQAQAHPQIEVEFQVSLPIVRQKIPTSSGTFTETERGVLFRCPYRNIESIARYLIGLNLPFVVHQPPVLRETFVQIAAEIVRSATSHPPVSFEATHD